MAKVNLKENIFVEGFDCTALLGFWGEHYSRDLDYEILYYGKTSEITEELAKECVKTIPHIYEDMVILDNYGNDVLFYNYQTNEYVKRSGVRSIQSACQEEYCIIYKEE